jgi:hypothetical protein
LRLTVALAVPELRWSAPVRRRVVQRLTWWTRVQARFCTVARSVPGLAVPGAEYVIVTPGLTSVGTGGEVTVTLGSA